MGESIDVKFLERLVDYLNKRYENRYPEPWKKEKFFLEKVENERFIQMSNKNRLWRIRTESGIYPEIEYLANGDIVVWSATSGEVIDIISLSCELDKVRITVDETYEVRDMIPDRRNWRKLGRKYRGLVAWLKQAEEVAREVTEKNGVKTVFHIPRREEGDRFHFIASFNSKGMRDEERLKMIEKALDAVDETQGRV